MPIINNLRFYRELYGISQSELAFLVCVSKNAISDYERGKYLPSLSVALKLAYVFDCSVEDLFVEVKEHYG